MAFGKTKTTSTPTLNLVSVLDEKAQQKAAAADNKRTTADQLVAQAGSLHNSAKVDDGHAEAIAKAVAILDEAGVDLKL